MKQKQSRKPKREVLEVLHRVLDILAAQNGGELPDRRPPAPANEARVVELRRIA